MAVVPEDVLALRKRTGADRWDEMWEGVLHMTPAPNLEHQGSQRDLLTWLVSHWAVPGEKDVFPPLNVASFGGWPHDYRISDLVLVTRDRMKYDRNEYFEGPPLVVVEIRSPGDETMEKLPFYARLGVPEVWVIDRDTKAPEIYALSSGKYRLRRQGAGGWITSPATGVRFRAEPRNKLAVQMGDDEGTRQVLPRR